ncbi:MAG: hypothetical protein L0Y56_02390, partial [Nitrospira sp.]|nr:hypothetical protein [Nitrospira sp.]
MSGNLPNGVLKVYDCSESPSSSNLKFLLPENAFNFDPEKGRVIRAKPGQPAGFLVFGPYEKNLPAQNLVAVFSLMISDNTSNGALVGMLDVAQDARKPSGQILINRVLNRKDFSGAGKYVRFGLPFTVTSPGSELEFRLFYMGDPGMVNTEFAVRLICVIDPAVIKVEDLPPDDDIIPKDLKGPYVYNLKREGTSIWNKPPAPEQKLTITGWSTYMWKDMKTYPWDGPYKGKTPGEYADILVRYNANLTRTFCIDTWTSSIFPWTKVGNNKFDLEDFDETYRTNLRNLVKAFGDRGILVHLALFDNVALWDHHDNMTWTKHPWHPNKAKAPVPISNGEDGRAEFYNPNATVKRLQDKYIRHMVNSLKDLKNIIFQVCNEYEAGDARWHNWVADVIKEVNPDALVSASPGPSLDKSIADAMFNHDKVDIITCHTKGKNLDHPARNGWVTGDFKKLDEDVLQWLQTRANRKPIILSTDGSREEYAAMKDDMHKTAKTVVQRGLGIEFKDLYEPAAEKIKPLAERIKPSGEVVVVTDFCKGGERICMDRFDQQKIESLGGKVLGGEFANGTFTPSNRGGIEFTFELDTGKPYAIEFEIQGNIANIDGGEQDGGKVSLFDLGDSFYGISIQRMDRDYKEPGDRGIFRSILAYGTGEHSYTSLITRTPYNKQ